MYSNLFNKTLIVHYNILAAYVYVNVYTHARTCTHTYVRYVCVICKPLNMPEAQSNT